MQQRTTALALALAFAGSAHAANDADLAANLGELRAQIDEMKKSYEQRIVALEQKLAQAEAKAVGAERKAEAASAATVAAAAARPAPAHADFHPEIGLFLQGKYVAMKNVPERGITGFVAAAGHEHGEGGIEGENRRGFSVDHTELMLSASVDPYWRGMAVLAVQDGEVEVEEAWFQSLAIGHGVGLKGGRFKSGIGYLNEQHAHQWDFADAPLVYQAFFGSHGSYAQDGVQLKWLAPTPVFLEFGAEIGRGANFPGSDRNKNGSGAGALFAHAGGDVGIAHSWRAGVSYLRTAARNREAHFEDVGGLEAVGAFSGRSRIWGADFVWKWAPDGNPKTRNFKFQTEYFQRREAGELTCSDDEGAGNACDPLAAGDSVTSRTRTRQSGWYAEGVYQFSPQWRAGLRYEQLDSGRRDFGSNAANLVVENYKPKRASLMADYNWSEFSRVRLQYAHDRSMAGLTDHQWTLQYVMSLGAHGAHRF